MKRFATLRVFADIAAWMIAHEREVSAAEREAKQSALLALINERARKSLDRQSILQSVSEDVRQAFGAVRCAIFGRDPRLARYGARDCRRRVAPAKITRSARR